MTTKWWKCDLQIATPAWRFTLPPNSNYDLTTIVGKQEFADRYMDELIAKRIDVVALADHNTGEWIDIMVAAGKRKGIVVFPGCEVTTGSGADGIHIVVVGGLEKTSHDFDLLLGGALGFDHDHARYHVQGSQKVPGSSGKTLQQILEDLPDEYLIIAPHALTENGIASGNTVKGDIRWKALHHPRLGAVDPGDCSAPDGETFNAQFRRRELDHFPCLHELAFVSTSDMYSFADVGSRFCWVRMETPSLEAMRQAFLDYGARILCDWDHRLLEYADADPNSIRHAWLSRIELNGVLGNSTAALALDLHPALNVIIGGRGSGKSTVVAAIRQLYSSVETLPDVVRQEAQRFVDVVFPNAELNSIHRIQNSQETQTAKWTKAAGSITQTDDKSWIATDFRVRVVNQKELFARVSNDQLDPLSASRSFLAFVDESLGLLRISAPGLGSWWRRFEDVSSSWAVSARDNENLKADLARLPTIRAAIRNLEGQVAAFDSPEAKTRREKNEARVQERTELDEREALFKAYVATCMDAVAIAPAEADDDTLSGDFASLLTGLASIQKDLREKILVAAEAASRALEEWTRVVEASSWAGAVAAAVADDAAYLFELSEKGIDPDAYTQLKTQLAQQQALEKLLALKEPELRSSQEHVDSAWEDVRVVLQERFTQRDGLLSSVARKSSRLRFELHPQSDTIGWVSAVRELLGLRVDGFLSDVPRLADWIWGGTDGGVKATRWALWRHALVTGDLNAVADDENAGLRKEWQKRLESLDPALRLRLATEVAGDTVEMQFLKDRGDPEVVGDWQDITQGSPGQRTAAMLAFVLHHGSEPLILDQPEDDLDTEWISKLVVRELRASRWKRQIIVVTHNANIPVNGDAERIIVLENNSGALRIRETHHGNNTNVPTAHCGAIEVKSVREDIQNIMEGGIRAFVQRERKYNNEVKASIATGS